MAAAVSPHILLGMSFRITLAACLSICLLIGTLPGASGDTEAMVHLCLSDASQQACATYTYPEDSILEDIELNCFQMPWMIGCGIWEACQSGDMGEDNQYCEPFSILATSCLDEGMDGMAGCKNYLVLCEQGSLVPQCAENAAVPRALNTASSQEAVVANCGTHNMPGCEDCTGLFNLCANTIEAVSSVCHAHNMEMCAEFDVMCSSAGSDLDYFCAQQGSRYDPPMRMYFHTGITDIMLFRKLVPKNGGEYFGVFIVTMCVGIITGALRLLRSMSETKERFDRNKMIREDPEAYSTQAIYALSSAELPSHLGRTALSFVIITLDYALMLIAMTFNVGIFFAVVIGLALGLLLFNHIQRRYSEKLQAEGIVHARKCACAEDSPETTGSLVKAKYSLQESQYRSPHRSHPESTDSVQKGNCCTVAPVLEAEDDAVPAGDMQPGCCTT